MRTSRILNVLCLYPALVVCTSAQVRLQTIVELDAETSDPSLSPDGKTLAFKWCKPDYSCALYTRPLEGGEPKLFAGEPGTAEQSLDPIWSPDGRKLAFRGLFFSPHSGHLLVRPLAGGQELDLGPVCDGQVSWSPDGRFFAAGVYRSGDALDGCRLALISAETGQRVRELAPHGNVAAFSPDGALLAFADGNELKLLSLTPEYQPQDPARTLAAEPGRMSGICWSRDGKQLMYQAWDDSLFLRKIGLEPGAQPQLITNLPSWLKLSEMLPDGSGLGTEYVAPTALWRVDLRSPKPKIEKVRDLPWTHGIVRLSPDGLRLAFVTTRTGHDQIWLSNPDGTNERPLVESIPGFTDPEDRGYPFDLEWSPDGQWIAFTTSAYHGIRYWLYVISSSDGPVRRLAREAKSIGEPIWAGDGKSIFGALQDHERYELVRIDLAAGTTTQITHGGGFGPRPSADGHFLYYFTFPPGRQLSRAPVSGGVEERLTQHKDYDAPVAGVGPRYLYLLQELRRGGNPNARRLVRFDPVTRKALPLATIPVSFRTRSAHLTGDGRYLYFQQAETPRQRVVLVRGL